MSKTDEHVETMGMLRKCLKLLLFRLASRSETPSLELEALLQEVITELYLEAQEALRERRGHLRLLPSEEPGAVSAPSTP